MSLFEHEAPVVGLREQKKHQTRLELCRAARRLVLERGLDGTTVEDVAKAARVSPRTFFNYYETKLDAVVGPVGDVGTPQARAQFVSGGPTGLLIEDLIQLYAAGFDADSEVHEAISQMSEICRAEPRVLAGLVAAGATHESAIAELLSARIGEDLTPEFALFTATLMSTLATRAAMKVGQDPDRSLSATLRDYCAMATRLFAPTAAHATETPRHRDTETPMTGDGDDHTGASSTTELSDEAGGIARGEAFLADPPDAADSAEKPGRDPKLVTEH